MQESENILLWKLSLGGKLRSFLTLAGAFLSGWDFDDDDDDDDAVSKQWLLQVQLSTSFRFSSLILAGLVVRFVFALLSDRIYIVADRREVPMLRIHKIEPKRQGFHVFPCCRISLSFSVFSRMSTSPRLFLNLNRFPLSTLCVLYVGLLPIYLVWFCILSGSKWKASFGSIGVPRFWMCTCAFRNTCSRWLSRGRSKRYARYAPRELSRSPSSSGVAVRGDALLVSFSFEVQRARFRERSKFAATFFAYLQHLGFVCFEHIFERESPSCQVKLSNGLKFRFEWVALVLAWSFEKGVRTRGLVLDKLRDQDSASRTRFLVFESNQFSFVPNRKGNIFRHDVSVTHVSLCSRSRWFLYRVFWQPRRAGDLFWIYVLDFRRVFAFCTAGFLHERGLYRILFKLLMNGWLVWAPFLPCSVAAAEKPSERRCWTSAITFLMPRSGTSFQWCTRRRWLCENLKYANSV